MEKPGPKPVLGKENEKKLREWVEESGKIGAPKTVGDIKYAAWGLSSKSSDTDRFKSCGPSDGWFYNFVKRNPTITKRKPESLSSASAAVTWKNVQNWFDNIEEYLLKKGYFDILADPTRILNMDEAGFSHSPSSSMVLVNKEQKNVYEVSKNAKEQSTVLWSFFANGDVVKPHIVFAGKRMTADMKNNIPDNVTIGLTDSGWMTQNHFMYYLESVLMPQVHQKGVVLPIIIFLDGHTSHESLEVSPYNSKKDSL